MWKIGDLIKKDHPWSPDPEYRILTKKLRQGKKQEMWTCLILNKDGPRSETFSIFSNNKSTWHLVSSTDGDLYDRQD